MEILNYVWSNTNTNSLVIPTGSTSYGFRLDVPPYGIINRIIVNQNGGTALNATVDLYCAAVISVEGQAAQISDSKLLYKICDSVSVTSGTAEVYNKQYYYRNKDDYSYKMKGYIYVEFTFGSATSEQTTWELALSIATATVFG